MPRRSVESDERTEIFAGPLPQQLIQPLDRIPPIMGAGAMSIESSTVCILFIDQHRVRLTFDAMRHIDHAAWLLPRLLGQRAEQLRHLFPVHRIETHPDSEADHRTSPSADG